MDQTIILVVGSIVALLVTTGVILTVREFRKMAQEPEKYIQPAYDVEEEKEIAGAEVKEER